MKEILLANNQLAFEHEDIAFVNTSLFTQTARDYIANGNVYTKASPASLEYKQFWDREEERLLNGMTAPGKLYTDEYGIQHIQEVHITGEHYGYLNFGRIKRTPDIQDILLGGQESVLKNKRVDKKEINFPDFWDGDYHYFKTVETAVKYGYNILVFKARRKGYSYKNGYIAEHKVQFNRNSTVIIGAYDKKYLLSGDGTTKMAKRYMDWYETQTDFTRGILNPDIENLELGYYEEKSRIAKGYRSKLLTVSFQNNPDAAIGKDADLILLEELGKFPNLDDTLDVTLSTVEDGDLITGTIIGFGTGGSDEDNWKIFQDYFYNPKKHNFIPFHNVWDDARRGTMCGFFHPQSLNMIPYIDEHGNSDVTTAREVLKKNKEQKRLITTTEKEYKKYVGQRCDKPAEGFNSSGTGIFDNATLSEHTQRVETDPSYQLGVSGVVMNVDGEVKFKPNFTLDESLRHDPINTYLDSRIKDFIGCFVQFYAPFVLNGKVPDKLYRVWCDPYAMKKQKEDIHYRNSLGSAFVYEKPNIFTANKGDLIVGSYVGRPEDPDDYNEHLLNICLYYNAELVFERDRGNVHEYFKRRGYEHLLADEPTFRFNTNLQKKGKQILGKGIMMSEGSKRKEQAAQYLKKWLMVLRNKTMEGQEVYNVQKIFDLGLLQELKFWNLKDNFDRVSALLVGMLDREEIFDIQPDNPFTTSSNTEDFWNRTLF